MGTPPIARTFAALGCLALAIDAASAEPAPSCNALSADSVELPAAFTADGHVFVRAALNHAAERWFVLDTATTPSSVDLAYARSAGLPLAPGSNSFTGVAGSQPSFLTRADVQSGPLHIGKVAFAAQDFAPPAPDGTAVAGLLGASFFAQRILTIDYPGRRVWIGGNSIRRCREARPVRLQDGVPITKVRIAGREIETLVDTGGAYELLIQPVAAPRLGLGDVMNHSALISGNGYGGSLEVHRGPGPMLEAAGLSLIESDISFIPLPVPIDGGIGSLLFRRGRLTIDYPARMMVLAGSKGR